MRRWLIAALAALGAVATTAVAVAATAPSGGDRGSRVSGGGGARGYFAVVCGFSHRNQDDPIVFFNQPGRSHDHTYFGNTSTKASSTPASLRAAGETTCRLRADTAAYWAPTLFVAGNAIRPLGAVVYYLRRTVEPVRAFPANLEVDCGNRNRSSGAGLADHVLELRRAARRPRLDRDPDVQLAQPEARRQLPELLGRLAPRQRGPQEPPRLRDERRLPVHAHRRGARDHAPDPLRSHWRDERRALVGRRLLWPRRLRERVEPADARAPRRAVPEPQQTEPLAARPRKASRGLRAARRCSPARRAG